MCGNIESCKVVLCCGGQDIVRTFPLFLGISVDPWSYNKRSTAISILMCARSSDRSLEERKVCAVPVTNNNNEMRDSGVRIRRG